MKSICYIKKFVRLNKKLTYHEHQRIDNQPYHLYTSKLLLATEDILSTLPKLEDEVFSVKIKNSSDIIVQVGKIIIFEKAVLEV